MAQPRPQRRRPHKRIAGSAAQGAVEPYLMGYVDALRTSGALRDQYDSQIEELRDQVAEYEALRAGQVSELELRSLTELTDALIRARIAAGLSQQELARRLGLKAQQVQRYEATRYAGVTLERVQAVADALGVEVHERVVRPGRGLR